MPEGITALICLQHQTTTNMATFLFSEHVFGPVKSRRFGNSLGINLLPNTYKVCNYNCIYCECGYTPEGTKEEDKFAPAKGILKELEERLKQEDAKELDAVTYAGNGEPTLHPHFSEIAAAIDELRKRYVPQASIVLLTNGTTLHKNEVKKALSHIDQLVVKLDAGDDNLLQLIDQPIGKFGLTQLLRNLKETIHPVSIQSMFLRGTKDNIQFDNTTEDAVSRWLELVKQVKPEVVMIYSIARDTPLESLQQIPHDELKLISNKVEAIGLKTLVS